MDAQPNEKGAGGESDKPSGESNDKTFTERQDSDNKACPCCHKANKPDQLPMWKDSQWWQVIVAGILVPFGIYAAVWVYPDQLEEMRKATAAAIKAANVADESVKVTREISDRDQRPWVVLSKVLLSKPLAVGEAPEVVMELINSGRSPALDVHIFGTILIQPTEDKAPFVTGQTLAKEAHSKMILPPGGGTGKGRPVADFTIADQSELDAISAGSKTIYVIGRIVYRNVFREATDPAYETDFCFYITGTLLAEGAFAGHGSGSSVR